MFMVIGQNILHHNFAPIINNSVNNYYVRTTLRINNNEAKWEGVYSLTWNGQVSE